VALTHSRFAHCSGCKASRDGWCEEHPLRTANKSLKPTPLHGFVDPAGGSGIIGPLPSRRGAA
ncbi:hypothetical protein, partial [Lysobacter sp. N42]|uniref:hypothetical protein n=1 Tax=Lysobacter sp. N42 TaxID=2545719 RepID=UPI001A9CCD58